MDPVLQRTTANSSVFTPLRDLPAPPPSGQKAAEGYGASLFEELEEADSGYGSLARISRAAERDARRYSGRLEG